MCEMNAAKKDASLEDGSCIEIGENQCVFTLWSALCLMMIRVMLLSPFHVLIAVALSTKCVKNTGNCSSSETKSIHGSLTMFYMVIHEVY